MRTVRLTILVAALLASLGGCSPSETRQAERPAPSTQNSTPPAQTETVQDSAHAPDVPATFIDRVWKVAESSAVEAGQLYVFLSEGTLVIASPHGTPSLGKWSKDGESLTMVEEGISYKTDILALSGSEFKIRSHNPGGFVDIRFVPAE